MAATLSQQLAKEIVNSVHDILGHETFYAQGGTIYAGTDETRLGDYHLPAEAAEKQEEPVSVLPDPAHPAWREEVVFRLVYNGSVVGVLGITGNIKSVSRYTGIARKIASLIIKEQELNVQSRNERTHAGQLCHAHPDYQRGNRQRGLHHRFSRVASSEKLPELQNYRCRI